MSSLLTIILYRVLYMIFECVDATIVRVLLDFRGRVGGSNSKVNYSFFIEIFISFSARP